MTGTQPHGQDKITRISGSPIAEQTLASAGPGCDTSVWASFAVLALVEPIVDAVFGIGGSK